MCGAPSTVYTSGHIVVVLRRSPARITSPSLSPRCHADESLPRHFAGSRVRGTSSSRTCAELGGVVRSVLDRSKREEVRLDQPRCQTLPLSVYKGTWTHSPPLVAMHLLDRSCVSVVNFLKLHATFPNRAPHTANNVVLCSTHAYNIYA